MKKTITSLQASSSLKLMHFARCFFSFPSPSTPATQATGLEILSIGDQILTAYKSPVGDSRFL